MTAGTTQNLSPQTPENEAWLSGSGRLHRVSAQKWNSPTSAKAPPPWVVNRQPPTWLSSRAEDEGCPPDAVETWRATLLELGIAEVRLTSDVRGLTIDFDGFAAQAVNDDHAKPLSSALARGIDRCKMKQKSDDLTRAREAAKDSPATD